MNTTFYRMPAVATVAFPRPQLVQLSPRWHGDADRLDEFLDAAPAALRWAVELRDRSWLRWLRTRLGRADHS